MSVPAFVAAYKAMTEQQNEPPKPKKYPVYHSFLLWLLFGGIVLWIPCIYYFLSDKHQFKFL